MGLLKIRKTSAIIEFWIVPRIDRLLIIQIKPKAGEFRIYSYTEGDCDANNETKAGVVCEELWDSPWTLQAIFKVQYKQCAMNGKDELSEPKAVLLFGVLSLGKVFDAQSDIPVS